MTADTRSTSKAQMVAQEQLRQLLEASARYDRVVAAAQPYQQREKLGGASLLVQEAVVALVAVKRCIEILKAANSDEECAEAVSRVASILDAVEPHVQ